VQLESLTINDLIYTTPVSEEHFLSFETPSDKIAGFLRLSLPKQDLSELEFRDLESSAMIREVHIYGQSLTLGSEMEGAAQHVGLGSELIQKAQEIAQKNGYKRLAVISAVGTREYYAKLGFRLGELYMVKDIHTKCKDN